ncbi:MAG: sigma-70 family RNA polymerase sigma factor [Eubacteriales bacterium]|nr:sigma-70 family RNA polymerase sigma factor [Eubacteriales bacterium]
MNADEFAVRVETIRNRLYRTALLYLGSESMACDALDEAVYKALKNYKRLRQPEYFDTWITRILINECHNERKRQRRFRPMEEAPELSSEDYDRLPLKEAIRKLPKELKDVVILRYFSGYTLAETAQALEIPQGTAATRQRRALTLLRLELGEEGSK